MTARYSPTRFTRWLIALFFISISVPASAQYFGRNKVQYDRFEFSQFETEHFIFYFYPESEEAVKDAARMAERWYARHRMTYLREFAEKKPIILYANDADFHQTNVIQGRLGEGTGGVTEGLKQRVVMPLTGHYGETDHVLGHELVHSFQYDIAFEDKNEEYEVRFDLRQLPLWLVEGTAEYLSVGREDSHTAMWLRDAVLRDDLPTTDALTARPDKYFPYRYGQAYMAYIGGKYGDKAVADLYKLAGRAGVDSAFVYTLGIDADSLSKEWIGAVKEMYQPLVEGRTSAAEAGRLVISKDQHGGDINIAPALSPDGRYIAFLSERDLFSINLFIANAETGEIVQRLQKEVSDNHFDAMRFISSAGSWSPDGKQFAFITFAEGDNEVAIWDLDSGKIARRINVAGVSAMFNLSWSPDGQQLAIAGMNGGVSDLYVLDLPTNEVRQLTADKYADFQPVWSPSGDELAFVTDRGEAGTDFDRLEYGELVLGVMDVESGEVRTLAPFGEALHHNPQYSPDGRSLYFISDYDGYKDAYRIDIASEQVYRLTRLQTGVSGITATAPAMSVAAQSGRLAYSVYSNGEYAIYARNAAEAQGELMKTTESVAAGAKSAPSEGQLAGILPPLKAPGDGIVGAYLVDADTGLPESPEYDIKEYNAKLKLDYVAPPSVGVSVGGPFGTGVGGSLGFFFSDMLGNHNLSIYALANGTFKDLGGQISYLNQKHRMNYGLAAMHLPIIYGYGAYYETASSGDLLLNQVFQRLFIDQVQGYTSYPFSTTRRIEFVAGMARYGFDTEVRTYSAIGGGGSVDDSFADPDPLYLGQVGAAFVKDNSSFGFTSPSNGTRSRLGISQSFGTDGFTTITADYRKYLFAKPVTFAVRGLHIGNYGASDDAVFANEYLGSTYYNGFVRGYSLNNFEAGECSAADCPEASRLVGTRIAMASAEVRVPLLGNESLGLVNFSYLPTELSVFLDAGLAWTGEEAPNLSFAADATGRIPVASAGVSSRFLLFGAAVLEVYYAYPFQRPVKGWHWGLQLSPGW